MSEKDFAVNVTGIPTVGHISKKPCYLITLIRGTIVNYFIALDKPDLSNGFIQVKGIFTDLDEDEILKRFWEVVANTPKENIVDIMFPAHRILSIRSLVFNANKPSTLLNK